MNNREITKDIVVAAIQKGVFDNVITDFSDKENPDAVTPKIKAIADAFNVIHAVVISEDTNSTQGFKVNL